MTDSVENMESVEKKIGIAMRIGVALATLFVVAGIVLLFVNNGLGIEFDGTRLNMQEIFFGLFELKSGSYLAIGVLLLILTPVLRVVASIFSFGVVRDKKYVLITISVLIILSISFTIGIMR